MIDQVGTLEPKLDIGWTKVQKATAYFEKKKNLLVKNEKKK
jgi:hypothetical protein